MSQCTAETSHSFWVDSTRDDTQRPFPEFAYNHHALSLGLSSEESVVGSSSLSGPVWDAHSMFPTSTEIDHNPSGLGHSNDWGYTFYPSSVFNSCHPDISSEEEIASFHNGGGQRDGPYTVLDNTFEAEPYNVGNTARPDSLSMLLQTAPDPYSTIHPSTSSFPYLGSTTLDWPFGLIPLTRTREHPRMHANSPLVKTFRDDISSTYSRPMVAAPSKKQTGPSRGPISDSYDLPPYSEAHACGQCEKSFRRICDLKKHVKTHEDKRNGTYSCDVCPSKSFLYKKDLKRHRKTVHREENHSRAHPCKICGKEFIRPDKLLRHERARHPG